MPARIAAVVAAVVGYVALHLVVTALEHVLPCSSDEQRRCWRRTWMSPELYREEAAGAVGRAWWWTAAALVLVGVALWLRRSGSSASAEVLEVVGRFVPRRPRWRRPVFLVVSGLGHAVLVVSALGGVVVASGGWASTGARLLAVPAAGLGTGLGLLLLGVSRRRAAEDALAALRADRRAPVLYLRGFVDDDRAAAVDGVYPGLVDDLSREEKLATALDAVGPVIAVAEPGQRVPHLGAARFSLPPDDWQAGVLRLMDLSRLVVLHVGPTEGLWWELERALATQPPDKVVLLVPSDTAPFAERLARHVPVRLPARTGGTPWIGSVVTFGPDGTPAVHPVLPVPERPAPTDTAGNRVADALGHALPTIGVDGGNPDLRVRLRPLVAPAKVTLLLVAGGLLVLRLGGLLGFW